MLVIQFNEPKVVRTVPEQNFMSDKIIITEMVDDPVNKKVTIRTDGQPFFLTLWEGDAYDAIGDWTTQDVIDRINQIIA